MATLDNNYLYVFFENHKRKGWLNEYFGQGVRNDAQKIKSILKSELEVCNHIGFLFYDKEWKIAELDYFRGGRIVRNITENGIQDFQIYPITKNTDETMKSIYDLFKDKLQKKYWVYSWRRYDFLKCIDYIKNSKIQRGKTEILKLRMLSISILKKPSNAGWTCVEVIFHILDKHQCNPFKIQASPYELLNEISLKDYSQYSN